MSDWQDRIGSSQNIGKRENQEDAMGVSEIENYSRKGILMVLSDGMGGMEAGEKFSGIAVEEMLKCFEQLPISGDMGRTLLKCYGAAHRRALAEQSEDEDRRGGATVVSALVLKGQCMTLTVGDSRIDLVRGGSMIQLNRQQVHGTRLDELAALGEIGWDEARGNLKRHALINHIGRRTSIGVDMTAEPFDLIKGDRLLLMSDGVFGTLTDSEILSCIKDVPAGKAADSVIEAVMGKGKPRQDNCSIMIMDIE